MTIERIDPGPRMSQAVVCGNLVFTAGQVAENSAGAAVGAQTREILTNIDALLARGGSDRTRILSVTIYLTNMIDFDAMNAVYDEWVDKANPPARACVQAALAGSEFTVEIAVIASR
jgi:enamine deaminase RidA (YjgF/YER057c/UK114 family)